MQRLLAGWAHFKAWLTLANVTKATDLALKLAALLAIFAVLNFFKGRGDVYPVADCWAPIREDVSGRLIRSPLGQLLDNVHLTSAEAHVTQEALIQSTVQQPFPLSLVSSSMRIGCSADIGAIEDLRSPDLHERLAELGDVAPAGPLPPQQRARRIALLRRIYPDSGPGAPHFVPLLAVQIAADPTLSLKKLRRILDLIEQSRKIVIFVHVANTGDADALDVKIPPPKGFDLIAEPPVSNGLPPDPEYQQLAVIGDQPIVYQSHPTEDLDPGESVYFIFESEDSRPSAVHLSDIVPEADTTPAVNISLQLIVFGALLVGILVPLVIREIKNTPRDGTPPVAEDDE